jgi:hypothetical protein
MLCIRTSPLPSRRGNKNINQKAPEGPFGFISVCGRWGWLERSHGDVVGAVCAGFYIEEGIDVGEACCLGDKCVGACGHLADVIFAFVVGGGGSGGVNNSEGDIRYWQTGGGADNRAFDACGGGRIDKGED